MLIAGPGRCYALDAQAQWLLVAGDESAIPAVATILEVVPDGVRTAGPARGQRCGGRIRDRAGPSPCQHPLAASRATPHWPWRHGARRRGIVAAAIARIPATRGHRAASTSPAKPMPCAASAGTCCCERALPREWVTTRGYWKQGATDYPDRDYGEDGMWAEERGPEHCKRRARRPRKCAGPRAHVIGAVQRSSGNSRTPRYRAARPAPPADRRSP